MAEKGAKKAGKNNKSSAVAKSGEGDKKEKGNHGNGGDGGEKTSDQKKPPPPEEVVLKVYLHCQGCVKKVMESLKGLEGVDEVITDQPNHRVVVKGRKAAENPLKVVERVKKKSGKKVELISPKDFSAIKSPQNKKKDKPKSKDNDPKEPQQISAVLSVHMHCQACEQNIKKTVLKMKGVTVVEVDLEGSKVTVKGAFEPAALTSLIYKKTGKRATIVKQEAQGQKKTQVKKQSGTDGENKENKKQKKLEGGKEAEGMTADGGQVVVSGDPFYRWTSAPSMGHSDQATYPLAPQIFSDENPNACVLM